MDVEGWEWSVMGGAKNLVQKYNVQNIIMEYSPGLCSREGGARSDVSIVCPFPPLPCMSHPLFSPSQPAPSACLPAGVPERHFRYNDIIATVQMLKVHMQYRKCDR